MLARLKDPPRPSSSPPRDAAMLACTFSAAAAALRESRWPRFVRIGPSGTVLEPANGAFDVTVAPGEGVQAAVDRCPRGGCVLLLPGTHEGPLTLRANQEVHVFGRGQATLRTAGEDVLSVDSAIATVDGLTILQEATGNIVCAVVVLSGAAPRLQNCDVSGRAAYSLGIQVVGSRTEQNDPVIIGCTCERGGGGG